MPPVIVLVVPFIHPALAGAAVATGLIPILIHLINRRRYRRVPWAAMSFLLMAKQRSIRRMRLEQWLLLLVRIAVIVLLGLALARPYLVGSPLAALGTARSHHVVLLDNSRSMNAVDAQGGTRFTRAKRAAEALVVSLPDTDAVSIVTLAHPAEAIIEHAAYDRRFVRERLAGVQPTQRATDTTGAITRALDIVRASEVAEGNRAVYLVSDLPRADWHGGRRSAAAPAARAATTLAEEADLTVIRVADEAGNLAVVNLTCETSLVGVKTPVRFRAEVVNHSNVHVRDGALRFQHRGRIFGRVNLPPIAPGQSVPATASLEFSSPGTHIIQAKLVLSTEDALEDDNERFLSVEVRETAPVLLVDGRPGATLLRGQAGYLATALAPKVEPTDVTLISPEVITELELAAEALGEYDAVILCNVQRFSDQQWKHLESFVAEGGGLIFFMGDLVSTDNYNRFGFAGGEGLLPGKLGRRVGEVDRDRFTTLKREGLTHPVVAEFADFPDSGLFLARIHEYVPCEVKAGNAEVVLRYANDDPALIVSRRGRGYVALMTTSADMSWNNLPAKGDFVSLMANLQAFVSPPHGQRRNVLVGEAISEPLTPAQSSLPLRVTTAAGRTLDGKLVPLADSLGVRYGPVEQAGALTFAVGEDSYQFAANVDPGDSDLRAAAEVDVTTAAGKSVRFVPEEREAAQPVAAGKASELTTALLYLVVALLFYESFIAMRFGTEQQGPGGKRIANEPRLSTRADS